MLTELQTKKWTRLFQVYDVDGNGTITQEDFELIFQNLAKFRNLEANTPQSDQLHAKYMEGWELVKKNADKDNDGKVQLEEWLEHAARLIHDESMYQTIVGFVNQLFDLLDLDGNGVITIKEYKTILSSWHVSEDLAAETFPKLDLNGDGHISKEEFMELARQFHASDDPQAPGNWFLGSY